MNIPNVGVDLRVSIGRQNTEDDIAILAQTLGDIFDMS
jgi:cysteine sulfinate desulfinase/cysteine desulfurase-like protein